MEVRDDLGPAADHLTELLAAADAAFARFHVRADVPLIAPYALLYRPAKGLTIAYRVPAGVSRDELQGPPELLAASLELRCLAARAIPALWELCEQHERQLRADLSAGIKGLEALFAKVNK